MYWVLRLYPRDWRERYGDELLAVLEQQDVTFITVLDLIVGALDATLHRKDFIKGVMSVTKVLFTGGLAACLGWFAYAGLAFAQPNLPVAIPNHVTQSDIQQIQQNIADGNVQPVHRISEQQFEASQAFSN